MKMIQLNALFATLLVIDLQLFSRAAVDTDTILSERRDIDFSKEIAELEPNKSPLITVTKMTNVQSVGTAEWYWFEDELKPRFDAINNGGGYADSDTSLVVDTSTIFTVGDLIKVPRTGEVILVTEINDSTKTLTVKRGFGTTTAAGLNDDEPLMIIGSASEENSRARNVNLRQPTKKGNYTGITKTPVAISGTSDAERLRGPGERRRLQRKYGIEHAIDLERMFLYGEPKEDTTGNHPMRTSGGILYFCTENNIDFGGTPTEAAFEEALEDVFRYGSGSKLALCSARWLTTINQWAVGKLQMLPKDKTYGINVTRYLSAHGELSLVKHHLLEGAEYGGYMIILDMDNVKYRPLRGRDTKLRQNIGEPDRDGFLDEYLTEAGYEIRLPKTHAVLTGAK